VLSEVENVNSQLGQAKSSKNKSVETAFNIAKVVFEKAYQLQADFERLNLESFLINIEIYAKVKINYSSAEKLFNAAAEKFGR
jgi:hypothetical protein